MSHKQVGCAPGEDAVDWCLYQLNGTAELEVSEGDIKLVTKGIPVQWSNPRSQMTASLRLALQCLVIMNVVLSLFNSER
ncbi:hypothetical protein Y1Q_0021389 [Alligator mississippiensis]|uniref:Uncharacterized protein n=1 Tax=Alligator mississippiensis TaxID=8496 RepID=A0A151P9K5_ALLMI|nr:hypothetical protein Y1Q_0021389 [Alligator mississippiensis]